MGESKNFYEGRRISYDGALCTIRSLIPSGQIPGTKGEWLGVEWDDLKRGKHNGTYGSHQYFKCKSSHATVASFIRPTRKPDPERTVLEAIQFKYGTHNNSKQEAVVISGKVAEEIGFDKISKEQSILADLRIILLDQLVVNGIALRGSSSETIEQAQIVLARTCPNVIELDLGYNPIEKWSDVEEICKAFPKLRVLRLNSLRFNSLSSSCLQDTFLNLQELHLNECLMRPVDLVQILDGTQNSRFPKLQTLWLSQNELEDFNTPQTGTNQYTSVHTLMLENNFFRNLDSLRGIFATFPNTRNVSMQSNLIKDFGEELVLLSRKSPSQTYANLDTLNLSMNQIETFNFVDQLPLIFPNLVSLRISRNPIYDTPNSANPTANASEISYYLTLAQIPKLRTLNYTTISIRERDEGEIYYLSVAEKEIKKLLSAIDLSNTAAKEQQLRLIQTKFPRYEPLCEKHDRESILSQLSPENPDSSTLLQKETKPVHPPGSLASRLVDATFYIPESQVDTSSQPLRTMSFVRPIPSTIASTQLFALVARRLSIIPLQFRLVYESTELDPVRDDLTTRSQMYSSTMTAEQRWKEWGQWDVDHLVDATSGVGGTNGKSDGSKEEGDGGTWDVEGYLVRDGKKWKRREVEVLVGMRAWGDYLDLEPGTKEVRVRVELKGHMLRKT